MILLFSLDCYEKSQFEQFLKTFLRAVARHTVFKNSRSQPVVIVLPYLVDSYWFPRSLHGFTAVHPIGSVIASWRCCVGLSSLTLSFYFSPSYSVHTSVALYLKRVRRAPSISISFCPFTQFLFTYEMFLWYFLNFWPLFHSGSIVILLCSSFFISLWYICSQSQHILSIPM